MLQNTQLKRKPFAHQIRGIEAHLANPNGFANFSLPGTGKTLMAIGAMNAMEVKHVVIVCPNSLKLNWEKEIQETSAKPWLILIPGGLREKLKKLFAAFFCHKADNKVVIVNYESLSKMLAYLQAFHPQLMIADEAAKISNHRAQRTRALKSIPCTRRLAMTGTPVANNPLDIWSIMDWVRPGYLGTNFYAFRNRHCIIYTGAGFPIIKGYLKLPELKEKIARLSFRVLKEECLDLPEKVFTVRLFNLSVNEAEVYKAMAREMVAEVGDKTIAASTAIVKLLRLQQITGGFLQNQVGTETQVHHVGRSKLEVLHALLEELQDQKVLIWARFKEEIKQIQLLVQAMKRECYRFTGDESTEERQKSVDLFQTVPGNAVMVGTAAAGGMGLTLTAASHCVYYSNSFSLPDRLQSQDRIHRIGQRNACTYYDLVAKGTIDEYVLAKLSSKVELSDKLTGDDLKRIIYNISD